MCSGAMSGLVWEVSLSWRVEMRSKVVFSCFFSLRRHLVVGPADGCEEVAAYALLLGYFALTAL